MTGKVLIIIPAYNEEENIVEVIRDIRDKAPVFDIVVIDDGSMDNTRKVAKSLGVTVLRLPFNLGIGAAVQTGYKYAYKNGYHVAIQFDGDGQHRADQIRGLIEPVLKDAADFVIGSRFLKTESYKVGMPRRIGIKILSTVISGLIGQKITDPTSGFRVARGKVIEFFARQYPDDYPEPESIVLLHKAGFRITEVPALMRERRRGSSSITPFRAFYYMVKVLLAIMIDMLKSIPRLK